ncbi:putative acyl-activating enzyme 9 [Sesamum angolense]|uniref:Acyl-activating enzyme 9 n=1 Tax=Sesamum angolense TaxID=2727404 RepID=A0AAE1XCS8_9LAMI|nr:putative acyl-activating enzyme 9 [Sesamum angolense]
MCGAPVVLNMLTNHPGRKPLDTLRPRVTTGAVGRHLLQRLLLAGLNRVVGFIVSHGYGLTETGGPVVTCAWKQEWNNLAGRERAQLKARQGVGMIGCPEVDVVEPDSGKSVARDGSTMGEIVLRGGSTMLGYLKDPEGTSKCMREDGWFYTGDVGVMHPDGCYLEVNSDRSKDVIMVAGARRI